MKELSKKRRLYKFQKRMSSLTMRLVKERKKVLELNRSLEEQTRENARIYRILAEYEFFSKIERK